MLHRFKVYVFRRVSGVAKFSLRIAVTSSLTGLLDTLGESNKTFAKISKVITLAQIAIDTGKALSAGIAPDFVIASP